ncbi:hypothetical protein, conserved [Plasmodium gonderi]|uniref:Uncharacterized protein n=1 Tax=Plasmodium gonderi TaxID=77519 RepID=A0A1Y1JD81_PLAGO|nr:hypothetical protein, conserved [Plasmodium gonderi]GAW80200.1 hypothetical protein, conserved [Plasmodium gonderi]
MVDHLILKEIRKTEYNHREFFEQHFGVLLEHEGEKHEREEGEDKNSKNESDELGKTVKVLMELVKVEKAYVDAKINEEAESYMGIAAETKTYAESIRCGMRNMGSPNMHVQKCSRVSKTDETMKTQLGTQTMEIDENVDTANCANVAPNIDRGHLGDNSVSDNNLSSGEFDECGGSDSSSSSSNLGNNHHLNNLHSRSSGESGKTNDSEMKVYKPSEKLGRERNEFENLLRKSIEAKNRLENIKRGLLFLKSFPTLKKNMNELFLTVKNTQLDVNDKVKKANVLYNNLLYMNEHEEIISYFKIYLPSIDICIYSSEFFEKFFDLINDIFSFYLIDKIPYLDMKKTIHIYVHTFRIYLKSIHIYMYTNEYFINQIFKNIIQFIVHKFSNTFLKFAQSESSPFIYNAIINYYEYFTAFIEERKGPIELLILQLISNVQMGAKHGASDYWGGKDISNGHDSNGHDSNNHDSNFSNEQKREAYTENFFVELYRESIHVVCTYLQEQSKVLSKSETKGKREDTSGSVMRKNVISKIMDALSVSINILSNSPMLIGKKNVLHKILNEGIFINKEIAEEYITNISDVSHFEMKCFEEINIRVNVFDKNDIMIENKLFDFFTHLEGGITNIIEKKKNEMINKDIFNCHFFNFIPYFSFIFNHDTEFLLLFINVYNFVYEIIYNIKDQIRRKKDENEKKKKKYINITSIDDESLYTKQDFDSANQVIQYVNSIITTFIKILKIFSNITKNYQTFGSFLFEKTYYHFKSNILFNSISKSYFRNQSKHPPPIYSNISHIHTYFQDDNFPMKRDITTTDLSPSHVSSENISVSQLDKHLGRKVEAVLLPTISENFRTINESGVDKTVSNANDESHMEGGEELDTEECGKYLLKSSLSKLNEIKNTILKNIIDFALIPLYDYLNKYINKFMNLKKIHCNSEIFDPEENICFIVDTLFLYINIFHEHDNSEYITEKLLTQFAEIYISSIYVITHLNEDIIHQLQADIHYFINVCERLKVNNYKPFFLLYHSLSLVLTSAKNQQDQHDLLNDSSSLHDHLNRCIKQNQEKKNLHQISITDADVLKAEIHIKHLLSRFR